MVKGMTYRLDYYEPALLPVKTAGRAAEVSLSCFLVVNNHDIIQERLLL